MVANAAYSKVDAEQLAFLQNLILVSNEGVTAAFQAFRESQDPESLAESLREVKPTIVLREQAELHCLDTVICTVSFFILFDAALPGKWEDY